MYSCAAVETRRDAVIKAKDKDKAKKAYSTLYNTLLTQVLPKQPNFTVVNKQKVLGSILKQDGMYVTDDDAEIWHTERISEEPGKTAIDRDQEQAIKDAVVAVHDATLSTCDSLKVV